MKDLIRPRPNVRLDRTSVNVKRIDRDSINVKRIDRDKCNVFD